MFGAVKSVTVIISMLILLSILLTYPIINFRSWILIISILFILYTQLEFEYIVEEGEPPFVVVVVIPPDFVKVNVSKSNFK